jgi:elongation factor P
MPTTSDFKRGLLIEMDGDPYAVEDYSTQTPSARGAATLVKAKLRNLRTKQLVQKTFKAGERVNEPDYEVRSAQYLYDEGGEVFYFMDDETYEQWGIPRDVIDYEIGFLRPNDTCRVVLFEGSPIGLQLPHTVVLEVTETEPAVKGDTVTNVTKAATLETGLEVQVPLFVVTGDQLVIDTRDARYVRRSS